MLNIYEYNGDIWLARDVLVC